MYVTCFTGHMYWRYIDLRAVGLTGSCSRAAPETPIKTVEASIPATTPPTGQLAPKSSCSSRAWHTKHIISLSSDSIWTNQGTP